MKKKRKADGDEETTRSQLARTILWFLGIAGIGLLVLYALERKLGLSPDAVAGSRDIFRAFVFLTGMAFVFYYRRRK